jgi:hypothetical protein
VKNCSIKFSIIESLNVVITSIIIIQLSDRKSDEIKNDVALCKKEVKRKKSTKKSFLYLIFKIFIHFLKRKMNKKHKATHFQTIKITKQHI